MFKFHPHLTEGNTILITGGCGFIGVNLALSLSEAGYKIRVLDNLSTGRRENLLAVGQKLSAIDLIIGDIRDQEIVNQAVKGIDAVVHLAAHNDVVESLEKPREDWDINSMGTFNLLESCRLNDIGVFVFASSNAVIGEQPPPIDETKVPKPLSLYGASKLAGEALCAGYYNSFDLKTVCLRFANCYGPYSEHKTSVTTRFVSSVKQHKPLVIYGAGNQTRDFVHVSDVCQAIRLCLTKTGSIAGETFQIGSGVETTINDLVRELKEISGYDIAVMYEPKRQGEIERNCSDITKARRMLGFEPRIHLKEGLKLLWQSYNQKTDRGVDELR